MEAVLRDFIRATQYYLLIILWRLKTGLEIEVKVVVCHPDNVESEPNRCFVSSCGCDLRTCNFRARNFPARRNKVKQ